VLVAHLPSGEVDPIAERVTDRVTEDHVLLKFFVEDIKSSGHRANTNEARLNTVLKVEDMMTKEAKRTIVQARNNMKKSIITKVRKPL
jgi:hypothetical protein